MNKEKSMKGSGAYLFPSSNVEALSTRITQNMTVVGDRVFKKLTKLKRGHEDGF